MKRKTVFLSLVTTLMMIAMLATPARITLTTATGVTGAAAGLNCDTFYRACDEEAARIRRDCEVRDEGAPPYEYSYTSCNCQGLRAYRACMERNLCSNHPSLPYDLENHPECFRDQ